MSMNNRLDFQIITVEGRSTQENVMFIPQKTTFDQSSSHGK